MDEDISDDEGPDDHEGHPGAVTDEHEAQFNHEAVEVPAGASPFTAEEDEAAFSAALAMVQEDGVVPEGYGLLSEEWEDEMYPTLEVLRSGRRGRREVLVSLPDQIWRPRAELWGRALDVMLHILE